MNFLFVLRENEMKWGEDMSGDLGRKGAHSELIYDVNLALQILGDPDKKYDNVIYGSLDERWQEIDLAASERGFGRFFLTGLPIGDTDRQILESSGITLIRKQDYDNREFVNRFYPKPGRETV